ncbi:MAG: hypothetical protein P4L50_09705 [Anaerolineaceae bacterium]|nr:hypothetical protein [Anaerolineaceae bacterium]
MDPRLERKTLNRRANRITGGSILILIGLAALLSNWFNIGLFVVLLTGIALLVWGLLSRSAGRIIPGSILSGVGSGILALQGPWNLALGDQGRSGIFLLCFALGWFLIPALTSLVGPKTLVWPVIPGSIMAVTGLILLTASRWMIQIANFIWPVILILVGLYLVLLWRRSK